MKSLKKQPTDWSHTDYINDSVLVPNLEKVLVQDEYLIVWNGKMYVYRYDIYINSTKLKKPIMFFGSEQNDLSKNTSFMYKSMYRTKRAIKLLCIVDQKNMDLDILYKQNVCNYMSLNIPPSISKHKNCVMDIIKIVFGLWNRHDVIVNPLHNQNGTEFMNEVTKLVTTLMSIKEDISGNSYSKYYRVACNKMQGTPEEYSKHVHIMNEFFDCYKSGSNSSRFAYRPLNFIANVLMHQMFVNNKKGFHYDGILYMTQKSNINASDLICNCVSERIRKMELKYSDILNETLNCVGSDIILFNTDDLNIEWTENTQTGELLHVSSFTPSFTPFTPFTHRSITHDPFKCLSDGKSPQPVRPKIDPFTGKASKDTQTGELLHVSSFTPSTPSTSSFVSRDTSRDTSSHFMYRTPPHRSITHDPFECLSGKSPQPVRPKIDPFTGKAIDDLKGGNYTSYIIQNLNDVMYRIIHTLTSIYTSN